MSASTEDVPILCSRVKHLCYGITESTSSPKILLTEDNVPVNTICINFNHESPVYEENAIREMFEVFGPVTKVKLITESNDHRLALISFDRCEDARGFVIQDQNYPHVSWKVADSWQQDAFREGAASNEEDACNKQFNILQLNEYCLTTIFKYLRFADLVALRSTSKQLADLVGSLFRIYESFDFTELREKDVLTVMDAKHILESVGPFVERLSMARNRFSRPRDGAATSQIFGFIPRNCNPLKELSLRHFVMPPSNWNSLAVFAGSLEKLILHGCRLNDDIGRCLTPCRKLKYLQLSHNFEIQNPGLQDIKGLTSLNVANCVRLNKDELNTIIRHNPQIEYLDITECGLNRITFDLISGLTKLTRLACSETDIDNLIDDIPNVKRLELTARHQRAMDGTLHMLASRNCVECLELRNCRELREFNLILEMTNLKEFKVHDVVQPDIFADTFLDQIPERTNIEELHVSMEAPRTQRQLVNMVRRNPQLKVLGINATPVEALDSFVPLLLDALRQNGSFLTVIVSSNTWRSWEPSGEDRATLLDTNRQWLKIEETTKSSYDFIITFGTNVA